MLLKNPTAIFLPIIIFFFLPLLGNADTIADPCSFEFSPTTVITGTSVRVTIIGVEHHTYRVRFGPLLGPVPPSPSRTGTIDPGANSVTIRALAPTTDIEQFFRVVVDEIAPIGPGLGDDCTPTSGEIVHVLPPGAGRSGENPCPGGICRTAIGELPAQPAALAARILRIGYTIAGGLALILMVAGSIRVLTSSGDQQRLAAGREMIIAAIAGLLFIIFSIVILRFIGLNVIGTIPGIP